MKWLRRWLYSRKRDKPRCPYCYDFLPFEGFTAHGCHGKPLAPWSEREPLVRANMLKRR